MDAGMAAIASMKRDSARRSRPPPAGQDFQFPAHPYAATATPASPPPNPSKHFSTGPTPASEEPSSIAALMISSDQEQESALPYAQSAAPALPPSAANVPLPLSPPPIQRFHLTDQPLPPLPDSPHTLETAELVPPPSHLQRVPPRAFTPPSSTDFYVVPHHPHQKASRDSSQEDWGVEGGAEGPPTPSRFAQPAFEAPWVMPDEYEKWDGAYDVPRDVYGDAERADKKRFRRKLLWCILAIIVVIAAVTGIAVGITKSNSSSALDNAAQGSTTSEAGAQLSSSTMVIVESASSSVSSTVKANSATSSSTRAVQSSTTLDSTIASTTTAISTTSSSISRVRSTSTALDDLTTSLPSSFLPTSTPLSTTSPTTFTAATRTTSSAEPSVTCVSGGTTILGFPVGATTTVLAGGESCPTSSASTRGSSSSSSSSDDDDDDDEDDDDSTGAHSAVLKRHRRVRRSEQSYRL
ncbi:hypothetical protein BCR35DRAFT_353576 [Leucosporidium creatinivorum]|uniref:Uncharacterized protein n=1 Tax=Leucosporidium creatinivorum TaxID=106004 RepID=A0A1Y2EW01_9BASI|nr:hypothetical protein BCR35DRAFT_353576 [Leucosporidium creatinivorum]